MSEPPTLHDDRPRQESEGNYEGFLSVVVCSECGFDHHVEGDVSNGEEIECEGCGRLMKVVNR